MDDPAGGTPEVALTSAGGAVVDRVGATVRAMGAVEKGYDEIVDLFARGGGSGAVLAFRPSDEAQARLRELLARSKEAGLSAEEHAELERFSELERLMQLVKARARRLSSSATR